MNEPNKVVVDEYGQIKSVVVGIQGPQGPRGFQGIDLNDAQATTTPSDDDSGVADASLIYCTRGGSSSNQPGFTADGVITIREIVNGGFY